MGVDDEYAEVIEFVVPWWRQRQPIANPCTLLVWTGNHVKRSREVNGGSGQWTGHAKVAMARKLAVRLYWMMRQGWDYEQVKKFGSHVGQPGHRDGVQ